nr:hypothetical protein [Tanacetum cinerariifolium]
RHGDGGSGWKSRCCGGVSGGGGCGWLQAEMMVPAGKARRLVLVEVVEMKVLVASAGGDAGWGGSGCCLAAGVGGADAAMVRVAGDVCSGGG